MAGLGIGENEVKKNIKHGLGIGVEVLRFRD